MSIVNAVPLLEAAGGDYTIAKSVRLRSSASGYLNRTFGTPTNALKWTWSGWVKRGILGTNGTLISGVTSGSIYTELRFNSTDVLRFHQENGATTVSQIDTVAVFRDPSAWYHIILVYDSANATSANRLLIYVSGVSQTLTTTVAVPLNQASNINQASEPTQIGNNTAGPLPFDGYLTEVNFIDGQALTPSSFGETDSITGVWKAKKYSGTYGTNGFYLNFSDNSSNTATTIGKDYSGNGNNWTPNNISVTAGATYDSMVDSPTVSAVSSNYCVLNPLDKYSSYTVQDGNLILVGSANYAVIRSTLGVSSGKWYFEATPISGTTNCDIGIATALSSLSSALGNDAYGWSYDNGGSKYHSGASAFGSSYTTNDVIGCAIDMDNGYIWWAKNNTWQASGNPSTGANPAFTSITGTVFPALTANNNTVAINFGQRPFTYTPPTGFVALNTNNLPVPTIKKPNQYMDATLWAGDNTNPRSITNAGFIPDLVWTKQRTANGGGFTDHQLYDSGRGAQNLLRSNTTNAELNSPANGGVQSFNTSGFTIQGSSASINMNNTGESYVAWQWKANGSAVTNTAGSITSQVNAGATQGFSVVTWTSAGAASATIGHGLGVAPSLVILKNRSAAVDWAVWHAGLSGGTYYVMLDSTAAQTNNSAWFAAAPTSTVISVGSALATGGNNTNTMVAYCFAAVKGFSAFGSYSGNGSADGPFIYTGFRPKFVLVKNANDNGNWVILDSTRDAYNVESAQLYPNVSNAEASNATFDFLSNGFKIRQSGTTINPATGVNIYAAFAENPFRYALAR